MKKYLLLTTTGSFLLLLIPVIIVVAYVSQGQSDAFQTSTETCGANCNTAKITPRNGKTASVTTYSTAQKNITVDKSIAPNLRNLLDAANKNGLQLGGWGYRDPSDQIRLRKKHCGGSSNYAVYQKPSSQCSPPTARPGRSQHEIGLAIDFTCNGGASISTRSSKCYKWLASNAHKYGLKNLPSEPWHWSTTGR